jgi:hypothetical protein
MSTFNAPSLRINNDFSKNAYNYTKYNNDNFFNVSITLLSRRKLINTVIGTGSDFESICFSVDRYRRNTSRVSIAQSFVTRTPLCGCLGNQTCACFFFNPNPFRGLRANIERGFTWTIHSLPVSRRKSLREPIADSFAIATVRPENTRTHCCCTYLNNFYNWYFSNEQSIVSRV